LYPYQNGGEEMSESQSPQEVHLNHDKWIAAIIWIALLVANLATSIIAVSSVMSGLSVFYSAFSAMGQYGASDSTGMSILGITIGILTLGAIVLILNAWLRFVRLSGALIISYAWLEEQSEESTIFSDLLVYPTNDERLEKDDEGEPDLENAESTLVSDVIRYLAYAWAVMLAIIPSSLIIGAIFS